MHKRLLISGIFILAVFSAGISQEGWHLVWSDEFDQDGLPDPEKWTYEVGYVRNNEVQYYTENRLENARVENEFLIIEARKEPFEEFEFTSASITTRGKAEFTYGRIEVKARLPAGRGTWPAIWMLGTSIGEVGWPACGEIDIMENVGHRKRRVHGHVHTEAFNHKIGKNKGNSIRLRRPWERFYVYAIEWFEDRIDFYVDDRKYFTYEKESDDSEVWPFDHPHYLLINLAIGGSWGGSRGIDKDAFPRQFVIEYVRVYELRS